MRQIAGVAVTFIACVFCANAWSSDVGIQVEATAAGPGSDRRSIELAQGGSYLSGSEIKALLSSLVARQKPLALTVREVKAIGTGVAYFLDAPALMALRDGLADEWRPWLSDQDGAPYWPHVTVQNKVAPKTAQSLARQLAGEFRPFEVTGAGLILWRYLGGPWQQERDFRFAGR